MQFQPLIQPKIKIGKPNDRYEQEADAMADQVVQTPSPPAIQRKCEDCEEETLQMKPSEASEVPMVTKEQGATLHMQPLAKTITPIVQKKSEEEEQLQMKRAEVPDLQLKKETGKDLSSTLQQTKGSGNNLPQATNQQMSQAFGADFSKVNIHTDSNAIQMNRSLGARAFTHGNDIYFNKGEFNPQSQSGKHLLAHELTHTIQQSKERNLIQRYSCRQIAGTDEGERVGGIAAHNVITRDFKSQMGDRAKGFRIPGATSTPIRLGCGDTDTSYVPPMEFVDQPRSRANVGIPDLAYVDDNRDVHLAEIKIGLADCHDMAINQVGRYVDQGNMEDPEMVAYKNSPYMRRKLGQMGLTGGGIENFRLMDPSSIGYSVPNSLNVDGTEVHLGDCGDGVILYKNIGESSEDRHLCDEDGSSFIDGLMDRAEGMVDDFIDRHVNRLVTQTISTLSIEDMIKLAYQHARPAIRELIIREAGEPFWLSIEALGDQAAVAALATYIQSELGAASSQVLREMIHKAKDVVIELVRVRMKAALRPFIQQLIQTLCEGSAAVSLAMALQAIQRNIRTLFNEVFTEIVQEAAILAFQAMVITAVIMLIIAIVAIVALIVICILLLPEILAALGIGGGGAVAVGGGAVAVGEATAVGGTVLGTGVTSTGVTLTLLEGGAVSTTAVASTVSVTEVVSAAAAVLLGFIFAGGEGGESETEPEGI